MKVLKPGKLPDATLRGTCGHCGCRVECGRGEAQWLEDRPGDGCLAVYCPTAGCCRYIYLNPAG